jgi:CRISPR/Cas system-associated exonuclease Cas4 (RecB family)
MAKYEHSYILHTQPCKPPSPHLTFGVMAHDVLYKAGKLRDEVQDEVVATGEYQTIIPSEVLYSDLKKEFNITNWHNYFAPIVKQTATYEKQLIDELINSHTGDVRIEREIKLQLTVEQLKQLGIYGVNQPIVGIIDLLIYTDTCAIIIDYKFSSNKKTQDDFDMNSQLPLYGLFTHINYDIPLHNIKYGYIDIPKQMFGMPALLSNGTLSRAKSQNVSQEMYEKSVIAIHGDDPYYNCKEGGYYYDCWCNLALNKAAYLSIQYLDMDVYEGVTKDLLNAAKMIDYMIENKLPFLKKYDAYSCKNCEYLNSCKKWLTVNGEY